MKKFILRIMACLMVAAMICTSFGATKASAAEGKFSGAYVGDYQAEFIPASAFEGCEDGAVVTFTCKKDEGWANPYWQYTFTDSAWEKLLDASLYAEGGRPNFNAYDFADVVDGDTATFSPEGVKKIIAGGSLGIQVAGIVLLDWTVTPVASDEPVVEEPVVDEPVADEPVADEPVADEPVADEPVADEPIVDEPVADEPVVDEPVADEPVADEPTVDEPVAEEPTVDEPVAEEPTVDEPVVAPETSDNTTSGREVKEGETVYTVQKGDCLWAIARQFLGNGSKYTELFDRNGDILTDATVIIPGQEIIIPAK